MAAAPLLYPGSHLTSEDGACLMEVVSTLAGEDFSDHPRCTDPVVAALARLVNDEMTDQARQSLWPLARKLAGIPRDTHGRVAASVVAAVTSAAVAQVGPSRGLDRHHRRATRRLAHLARRPERARTRPLGRGIAALYARGPAQHALTNCILGLRRLPAPARDDALARLLATALDAATQTVQNRLLVTDHRN